MTITIRRNFGPLEQIALTKAPVMREVGLLARERIIARTRRGLSAEGQPFRPYTRAYAAKKQAATGSSAPVNLTLSGGMLDAIVVTDVTDDSVTLAFSS